MAKIKLSKEQIAALKEELKGYLVYKKTKRAAEVKKILKDAGVPETAMAKPKAETAAKKKPAAKSKPKK
jgi:predicted metal-binding transcription factor (methanogenesis marker protein 9)